MGRGKNRFGRHRGTEGTEKKAKGGITKGRRDEGTKARRKAKGKSRKAVKVYRDVCFDFNLTENAKTACGMVAVTVVF
jgi:hypothetical protein